jgi:hypothetical protein
MLLGRQQDAVSRSANLAVQSASAYLEQVFKWFARSALAGGIGSDYGMGLFWRFCWGGPFLVSGPEDSSPCSSMAFAAGKINISRDSRRA